MSSHTNTCPLDQKQVLDEYFMEHRAKLLDLAAFLDRYDRAQTSAGADEDFRLRSFQDAVQILSDGQGDRVARVLDLLSDPTSEPRESAVGLKGADGAWPGYKG